MRTVFHHVGDHGLGGEAPGLSDQACLERWLAADPRHAGHTAKPIIPLETRTKAIELVLGGMRGSGPPNGSAWVASFQGCVSDSTRLWVYEEETHQS